MQKQQVIFTRPKKVTSDGPPPKSSKETHWVDLEHRDVIAHSSEELQTIKQHTREFEKLIHKGDRTLIKIKTVFPFKFFTDTIVVDENKINIIEGIFFFSAKVKSIPIHHIQDVEVESSVFFAAIKILPVGYMEEWMIIRYLWKKEALRARRIISGLLVGHKNGIDFSKVETKNFVAEIEDLGKIS